MRRIYVIIDEENLLNTQVETSKKALMGKHGLSSYHVYKKKFPLQIAGKIYLELYYGSR